MRAAARRDGVAAVHAEQSDRAHAGQRRWPLGLLVPRRTGRDRKRLVRPSRRLHPAAQADRGAGPLPHPRRDADSSQRMPAAETSAGVEEIPGHLRSNETSDSVVLELLR